MAFFDKLKDAAKQAQEAAKNAVQNIDLEKIKSGAEHAQSMVGNAVQKAKDGYQTIAAKHAANKAEQEAYNNAMMQKCGELESQLRESLENCEHSEGLWKGRELNEIIAYTKEFADKIILPANSVSATSIVAHPYIPGKKIKGFPKSFPGFSDTETALLYFPGTGKGECMLSSNAFYFSVPLPDDAKYEAHLRITTDKISRMEIIKEENTCVLLCNGKEVMRTEDKKFSDDAIALQEYFRSVAESDFTITDAEVDAIIHKKIGDKIYAQVKKYMIYEDELAVFFAWGVDSLTAKDYIVCTTKQIIIMDRELFGATANIKQFYYEDITSINTEQNSKNDDLTGYLLETALTSVFKQCDLDISVAGAKHKIQTLNKAEAERVIAIYHQCRKAAKQQMAPQIVVQAPNNQPDAFAQLEKLAALKAAGILTEEEFQTKKKNLLEKI